MLKNVTTHTVMNINVIPKRKVNDKFAIFLFQANGVAAHTTIPAKISGLESTSSNWSVIVFDDLIANANKEITKQN